MSRTIEAIIRHMGQRQPNASQDSPKPAPHVAKNCEPSLVAEWQTGVEIFGHAQRKLRLTFAGGPSPALAAAVQ